MTDYLEDRIKELEFKVKNIVESAVYQRGSVIPKIHERLYKLERAPAPGDSVPSSNVRAYQRLGESKPSLISIRDNKWEDYKPVHMDVWIAIKDHIQTLNMGIIRNRGTRAGDEMILDGLIKLIKKVDKEYCPND